MVLQPIYSDGNSMSNERPQLSLPIVKNSRSGTVRLLFHQHCCWWLQTSFSRFNRMDLYRYHGYQRVPKIIRRPPIRECHTHRPTYGTKERYMYKNTNRQDRRQTYNEGNKMQSNTLFSLKWHEAGSKHLPHAQGEHISHALQQSDH